MTLAPLERAARPLDQVRGALLQGLARRGPLAAILVSKERRLTALSIGHACVAFALAACLPVLMFVLGPILLGVAHVAADVRYLMLRRGLSRGWLYSLFATSVGFLTLRILELSRVVERAASYELGAAALWMGAAALVAARHGGAWSRAGCALLAIAALWLVAARDPGTAQLVFLHLHNLVALVAWAFLFRARPRPLLVPALIIGAGAALLASGALYRLALYGPGATFLGLHVLRVSDWLAPGLRGDFAVGLVTAYVFLQSIHYAIWLNLIPQEQTLGQGTLTFRMSLRSLLADFGAKGLAFVVVAAGTVLVLGALSPERTRNVYVSLATFHGYLELTMLTYFWVGRRSATRAPEPFGMAASPA